jgi:anaerobic selenocysteine-containing dehydrogenase
MSKKDGYKTNIGQEKSFPLTLGFGPNSNSSVVDVKDGKIVRVRPLHFDWKYDKKQFNVWKMEVRGKTFEPGMKALIAPYSLAYKKRAYSPNRILYPLKRIDWDPNSARNTQNRGKSKYVRISWDEALEIIVSEIRRIHKEYGPYGVLVQSDGHGESKVIHCCHGGPTKLLKLMGGYTLQTRNPDSWEGTYWGSKHAWGMESFGEMNPAANIMYDAAKNAGCILFWGCDPETTPWAFDGQMASRLCYWWTEVGVKSIYICPDLNYGAAVHADKWIPVMPNTDAAFRLAIAYIWLTEGTYDKEYVATHTYGFDKFEEYVTGKEDGIPKTPEWASEKCGVPEWTIKALARYWAKNKVCIAHGNGGPGIRGPFSTENARLEVLLFGMQGLGKPGVHQLKMIEWDMPINDNTMPEGMIKPELISGVTGTMVPIVESLGDVEKGRKKYREPGHIFPKQFIPKDLIHEAILNPPISWYGTTICHDDAVNQFTRYTYPAEGCPEVHMIWTTTPCWITCWNDTNTYIKALRSPKIEFILAQHPWLENDCLFSDLILPINTKFEEADINVDGSNGQFIIVTDEKQCIKPVGESVSDYDAVCLIAAKLGLLKEFTKGEDFDDKFKKLFESTGIGDFTTLEEFTEKGYFVVPTNPDWEKAPVGLSKFYEDPENNPLTTPTGKIEYFATGLAEHFPDDQERPPVPHWIEKSESHDERLSSERAKEYPLLVVSNHGRWRVHAQCDDITWTREVPTCKVPGPDGYKYEPVWLNPAVAEARDIKNGDIVKIYNERGAILCGAYVTERVMDGVAYVDHGARYDPIVPGELDRGGAINTLTPHNVTSKNATGMVVSGFLVEVVKVHGEEWDEWRRDYPEAFRRKYDPAAGLRFDAWIEKGMR